MNRAIYILIINHFILNKTSIFELHSIILEHFSLFFGTIFKDIG